MSSFNVALGGLLSFCLVKCYWFIVLNAENFQFYSSAIFRRKEGVRPCSRYEIYLVFITLFRGGSLLTRTHDLYAYFHTSVSASFVCNSVSQNVPKRVGVYVYMRLYVWTFWLTFIVTETYKRGSCSLNNRFSWPSRVWCHLSTVLMDVILVKPWWSWVRIGDMCWHVTCQGW